MQHYILQGKKHIPVDLLTWAKWFETNEKSIALSKTKNYIVSTIFLGFNHNLFKGEPLYYETMIFFPETILDEVQMRSSTYENAELNHKACVSACKTLLKSNKKK